MVQVIGLNVAYLTNTITFNLNTGESVVIEITPTITTGDYEGEAKSAMRLSRIVDGLIQSNLRYINAVSDLADIP